MKLGAMGGGDLVDLEFIVAVRIDGTSHLSELRRELQAYRFFGPGGEGVALVSEADLKFRNIGRNGDHLGRWTGSGGGGVFGRLFRAAAQRNPLYGGRSGLLLCDRNRFKLTDEYLSYRLELVLLKAQEALGSESGVFRDFLAREMKYRKRNGILVLGEKEENPVPFEAYTYRLSLLKKYMGEALFLNTKSIKKDALYKNYAAAVGAGLAATVAGLAEHQRAQYYTGQDSSLRIALLIGMAVLAYMFKDRVKDLSKEYFNTRLKQKLPDNFVALSHTSYTAKGRSKIRDLGTVSEYLRFLTEVPADVAYLRTLNQKPTNDPERRESILHVGRKFTFELRSKKHRKLFPLLKNVHRIDISPFLSKLDNPSTPISFVDELGEARTVQAPKVYHINAVLRYETRFGAGSQTRYVDYERVRLIINKNGIVRLERVLERGRLGYEEEVE